MASINNNIITLLPDVNDKMTSKPINVLGNRSMVLQFDVKANIYDVTERHALDLINKQSIPDMFLEEAVGVKWEKYGYGSLSITNQIAKIDQNTIDVNVGIIQKVGYPYPINPNVYDDMFYYAKVKVSTGCNEIEIWYKTSGGLSQCRIVSNPEINKWIEIYGIRNEMSNFDYAMVIEGKFDTIDTNNTIEIDGTAGIYSALITNTGYQHYDYNGCNSERMNELSMNFLEVELLDKSNAEEYSLNPNGIDYGDTIVVGGFVTHGGINNFKQQTLLFNTRYYNRFNDYADATLLTIRFKNYSSIITYEISNIILKYENDLSYTTTTEILVEVQYADFTQENGQIMTVENHSDFITGSRTNLMNGDTLIIGGLLIMSAGVLSNGYDFIALKYDSGSWL